MKGERAAEGRQEGGRLKNLTRGYIVRPGFSISTT